MTNLKTLAKRVPTTSMSINTLCKIRSYIPIKEKFEFLKEYDDLMNKHINDYKGFEVFVGYVFFNLLVVKKYTDIELELTYEEFDILQENKIINKIIEIIGDDYSLLLNFANLNKEQ